jgi:hypothetical protein
LTIPGDIHSHPEAVSVQVMTNDKQPGLPLFKNSLRMWQAQWKAQKAQGESAQKAADELPKAGTASGTPRKAQI